ncbi:hypothetical protein OH76DRAFT_1416467 [Lentinus brumalis]|uniref:Uncharacterized protein n=1 Tax=Lentinus brumalis TaxID=2498619 RepID=A0A371DJR7_9APHY|nr:hypothetical protein OH76DRAFT_1416467 [Polyporus brumalis]
MSSVPNHYNADDRVRWERYAAALQAYGAGRGPHPGNTPAGYREVFKISQRFAPVPEDYPAPAPAQQTTPQPLAGVNMSDSAFNALLAHTATVNQQFAALQSKLLSDARRGATARSYEGRGRGGGPVYGRRGQRLVDRVSARLSGAPTAGPSKRKRGHRGGRGRDRNRHAKDADRDELAVMATNPAETAPQPGEYGVTDFMHTVIDRFARMFYTPDAAVVTMANDDGIVQEAAAAPQEPGTLVDQDFQMDLEQIGEGEEALVF